MARPLPRQRPAREAKPSPAMLLFRLLVPLVVIAAVLLFVSLPASAQSPDFRARCERELPPPALEVKHSMAGYTVDRQLSFRDLTGMGADLLRHGKQHVLGITRAEMTASLEIKVARLEEGGVECLSPQVEIIVEYTPIQVFVGREFPLESCSYREILQHELRHVQAYRRHLPRVEASLRSNLSGRFGLTLIYGAPGAAEERLKAYIYDHWLPVVDREIRRVDGEQARIDSPQEYNRMERVCDGELQHYIGSAQ